MKMNPSKRKLNLLDEIAQIEYIKGNSTQKAGGQAKPQANKAQEWYDALNGEDNTHIAS